MITVYTLAYNEEILIQFMINHYRKRFADCHIVLYDNSSTDKTVEIAKANGCEIRTYDSGGTLNDGLHMQIKNTCWKDAKTDWVLMCDLDEMLDINKEQLKKEENANTTIIKSEAWTMVNLAETYDLASLEKINHAFRDPGYDKSLLFNKKHIAEINYSPGAHKCYPSGKIKNSNPYKLYHYQYIHPDLFTAKRMLTAKRLSEANRKNGWGVPQTSGTPQDKYNDYQYRKDHCIKIF